MSRSILAAVLGCLYVAILAWVVRSEGEAHRNALRSERDRLKASTVASTNPPTQPIAAAPKASSVPERPPVPSAAVARPAEPTPRDQAPQRTEAVPSQLQEPPVPPLLSPRMARDPAFVWADSLDLAHLQLADERRLGHELHRLIMTANRRMEDGNYDQRVEEVARSILEHRKRKDVEYTFTILDSDAVAAFSHVGGYVYICRGLFDMFGQDEDYVLEFIVGHEVAHVDLNHAVTFVERGNADEKKQGVSTLLQFYLLVAFGYPEAQEFEADAWIFRQMKQEGRTRRECLTFLRKFKKYAEEHGFASGGKPPDLAKKDASVVENHFKVHPAAWKRLARLEALAGPVTPPGSGSRP